MKREEIMVSSKEMKRQEAFVEEVRDMPQKPKSYYVVTYGCQMNAHDSEKLAGMLQAMRLLPSRNSLQGLLTERSRSHSPSTAACSTVRIL